ncbi:leucine efflux protein LeuE [Acinetobacter portensis]|uniref:Leucine efflux protein LeuE n=2 Tax=Acinetobacter TaxID=469 RepID=A0A6L6GHK1_9GAMM|nr:MULTISPECIES: leucine efflux protein LeuE [Acinetobacter]MCK7609620.1 leucine efflux protein LeuE [Acinetobacter portensis]MCK7640396.1 leucine efflux protein LeuE [Acinetobacter portensis]MDY6459526.1 leucine efflux protein LeuE [Acinetobacter faecalis]MDY6462339.1 leucine efflux protein LeuE [Acinetobacter faecalis]MDY6485318.1 leucine efflux protein LeuE [Acinetobacter faecalis]
MFGITDLATYIIGTILIVILPGPNSLFVMSVASRFGIKAGYKGALGVYTGDMILIILTALGAASLLHAFPWLFILLKVVGATYLSYLGIKLLIAAYHTFNAVKIPERVEEKQSLEQVKPFSTALTISILNPKAILFYLSFFVQFVDPAYTYPAITFTALAIILQIISMSYLTILIFSGAKLASYFSNRFKLTAICVASVGILFCGFGLKLATSTL